MFSTMIGIMFVVYKSFQNNVTGVFDIYISVEHVSRDEKWTNQIVVNKVNKNRYSTIMTN